MSLMTPATVQSPVPVFDVSPEAPPLTPEMVREALGDAD